MNSDQRRVSGVKPTNMIGLNIDLLSKASLGVELRVNFRLGAGGARTVAWL
jgi:hypothetical protein